MATAALSAENRELSVGRAFSRGFGTIAAHPFATFAIALIFDVLPSMVAEAVIVYLPGPITRGWVVETILILFATNLLWSTIIQGMIALTVLAHDEGRRADIVDTLPPAFMRLFSLILLGAITGLGVTFGYVFLVIPGIILQLAWWVAAPAMVVEHLGVIEALNRSSDLTRGARWHVFGINLAMGVAATMIGFAMRTVGVPQALGVQIGHVFAMSGTLLFLLAVGILIRTAISTVAAVMHASFYVELRGWKEGPAVDALADVFS